MSVSNFYFIDGEILAERAGATTLDYLPDAIGSVTVASDGMSDHSATYSPYGRGSAPSGVSMAWLGAQGYRPTGRGEASHYVRARHFSSTRATWTSVDPLWPSQPAYAYAAANPLVNADPSGMLLPGCINTKFQLEVKCTFRNRRTQERHEFDCMSCDGRSGCDICDLSRVSYHCSGWATLSMEASYYYEKGWIFGPPKQEHDTNCSGMWKPIIDPVIDELINIGEAVINSAEIFVHLPGGVTLGKDWYVDCNLEGKSFFKIMGPVSGCQDGCPDPCDKTSGGFPPLFFLPGCHHGICKYTWK